MTAAIDRFLEVPTMSVKVCSHRACFRPAPHGLGWGLSTGTVQWFCGEHFPVALTRLGGLLRRVQTEHASRRQATAKAA
jgi:hypothetical protein